MDYEKKYSFELEPVTQLCGQNIIKKTFVLESIRRYFSTFKYKEESKKWRENIQVDGEIIGRKYFSVLSISNISDVLELISWSKQSLTVEYVKQIMQKYDWQMHLKMINDEVNKMIQMINADMNRLGNLELSYAVADVWNMVQKTDITGVDQALLEDEENFEVLNIFLNVLEEVLRMTPRKMLVLIENIDHMITQKEYAHIIKRVKDMSLKYDLYFIFTTSLDGYVECDEDLFAGISIFSDVDFQMPSYEKIESFINDNYPCHKNLSEYQIYNDLKHIIHRIGLEESLLSVEELIICKLINQTLLLHEKWRESISEPEIAFLKSANVI